MFHIHYLLVVLAGIQNVGRLTVRDIPDGTLLQVQLSPQSSNIDTSLLSLVLLCELDVKEDSSSLAGVERMGNVGAVIRVGIANGVNAGHVGRVSLAHISSQTAAPELNAGLGADGAALLVGVAQEEGGALDGLALAEADGEEVFLGRGGEGGVVGRVAAVLEAGDGRDGAVVDGDVVEVEVLLELGVLGLRLGAGGGGVGAVCKGDDVRVEGQNLADERGEVVKG